MARAGNVSVRKHERAYEVWVELSNRRGFAASGDREINADRPTMVFVHGAGQDHSVWGPLVSQFVAEGNRNVLAVDLPGHGRSDGPSLRTIEEMADWLVGVLDATGVRVADVVGHSMGSLVALSSAAMHADRVRSSALISTAIPMPVSEKLLDAAKLDDHKAIEMITKWSHSRAAHRAPDGQDRPLQEQTIQLLERAGPGVLYADLSACNDYRAGIDHASAVRCPTLLILGECDVMTPPRATEALSEALADVDTVILPGAGHAVLAECPHAVAAALKRFVE